MRAADTVTDVGPEIARKGGILEGGEENCCCKPSQSQGHFSRNSLMVFNHARLSVQLYVVHVCALYSTYKLHMSFSVCDPQPERFV